VILFHLFGGKVRRFSELRRAIPGVSEKVLIQQLRQRATASCVALCNIRYRRRWSSLTSWGQALCPALDALLTGRSPRVVGGTWETQPANWLMSPEDRICFEHPVAAT
jgi:DNA-binding HxlR family transcriptional regulator